MASSKSLQSQEPTILFCDTEARIRQLLENDPDVDLSEEERAEVERKLVRRLDWKLIPWLCVLYMLAFLDRNNIGNAKIEGLNSDLGMSDADYNSTLTIFFVSYSVFEPLTNVLLRRIRPSNFIPLIMILWGGIMICMGFVRNYSELMATRWFLGVAEAGLFPGVNYYLSYWYKRSEFGVRAAIFFSSAALSGSFGGALAAVIVKMHGIGSRPGWSWIFILEGVLTMMFGIASVWMVHDFPHEVNFLTDDDRSRVIRRLQSDQPSSANQEEFKVTYFWQAVKDWKTWMSMMIYMGCNVPLYAFSLFLPTIVNTMGWNTSVARSQLMTVPPYAAAAVFTVFVGWAADRTGQRGLGNIIVSLVGILGFAMLLATDDARVQYAATFLGALGIYPCISNTITWVANNTEGVYKRGVVLGLVIGWGNLSGIVSSNIYFKAPRFYAGHGVVLGYLAICVCLGSLVMSVMLKNENTKRNEQVWQLREMGRTEQEILVHDIELGDQRVGFKYTL